MRARVKGINLLPKEYIQAEQIRVIQMIISLALVLEVLAFIVGIAMPPKAEVEQVQQQLDKISSKLNDSRFADVNKTIQELEAAKVEVEQWVAKYGDLKSENFIGARVLDSLTARLPIGMAIERINIKPADAEGSNGSKEIIIEGTSNKLEAILNYVTILESIYGVGTVYYDGSYDKEILAYKYKLDIKIPVTVKATEESAPVEGAAQDGTTPPVEQTEGGAN